MSMRITESDLLDALSLATNGDGPEDARTLNELITEKKIPRDRMLDALKALRSAGRLTVHRVMRETIDGRRTPVPAYTIAPKLKAKAKR